MDRFERATTRVLLGVIVGGASLGVVAASVLVGVVAARAVVGAGARVVHLATLAGVGASMSAMVAAVGWWSDRWLARFHPGMPVTQRRLLVALPWWPAVAAVAPLASLTVSGDVAHRLLNLPHEGIAFTAYLSCVSLVLHAGTIAGAWMTRPEAWARPIEGDGQPAARSTDVGVSTDAGGGVGPRASLPAPGHGQSTKVAHPDPVAGTEVSPPTDLPDGNPWGITSLVRGLMLAATATVSINQALFKYLTAQQGEFGTHRYAAIRLLRGDDPFDSMREVWQQINVPPVTVAIVYVPWAMLPLDWALLGWGILHVGAIVTSTVLVARAFFVPRIPSDILAVGILILLAVYEPWRDTIWLGQPNGFIFFFVATGLLMARRNRWFWAGACIAMSLLFKPIASWLALYVILTRRWSAMVGGAVTGGALVLLSLPLAGTNWWWLWLTRKAGDLALGNALHSNISLQAVHARLSLVSHAYYDAGALPSLPLAKVLNALMLVTAIMLVLSLTRRARPASDTLGVGLEWGLAIALSLTTSPLSWVHYSTMGIVAFIVLLASTHAPDWQAAPRPVRVALGTVAVVAFALLSMDEELFLVRTAFWWETWPMLGSIPAALLPLLVTAVALRLWLRNRWVERQTVGGVPATEAASANRGPSGVEAGTLAAGT